ITLVTTPPTRQGLLPMAGESVPRIPEGQRNITLTRMAGLMQRYGFSLEAMTGALLITNTSQCDPPLDPVEVTSIARSIQRYPAVASLVPQTLVGDLLDVQHFTDLGNAKRLVHDHGPDIRLNYTRNSWYIWDGTRWVQDRTDAIMRLAKATVERIAHEI